MIGLLSVKKLHDVIKISIGAVYAALSAENLENNLPIL